MDGAWGQQPVRLVGTRGLRAPAVRLHSGRVKMCVIKFNAHFAVSAVESKGVLAATDQMRSTVLRTAATPAGKR